MADHSKPSTNGTDPKLDVLTYLMDRINDACRFLRPSKVASTVTNPLDGFVRFNDTSKILETYNSGTAAWEPLADKYGINVDKLDGYDADIAETAGAIPVRNGSGKVIGSITGDAATVSGKAPGTSAGDLVYLDGSGKVPTAQLPSLSGDATTLSGKSLSALNTGDTIPLRSASGKIYAHVAGNIGSPNDNYNTGKVGDTTDFLKLYGECMGGTYGANSGVYKQTVPGTYQWTAPAGVNKIFLTMTGGGAGGSYISYTNQARVLGGDGGATTFGTLATANGGDSGRTQFYPNAADQFVDMAPGAGTGTLGSTGTGGAGALLNMGDGTYAPTVGPTDVASGPNGGTFSDYVTVTPGATYTVTVGAGGTTGTSGNPYIVTPAAGGSVLIHY